MLDVQTARTAEFQRSSWRRLADHLARGVADQIATVLAVHCAVDLPFIASVIPKPLEDEKTKGIIAKIAEWLLFRPRTG
jgi:hypothetical protein